MKILQIINSLETGGAERLIVETLPLLAKKDCKVDLLLLKDEETVFFNTLKEKHCSNIFTLGKSYYNPMYIFRMLKYVKNYDIVHVHLFPSQYFAAISSFFCNSKTKFIFTEHNTANNRINNVFFKQIDKFIYSFYQKIICITPQVKETLKIKIGLDDSKLLVIQNGINLEDINAESKSSREEFGFSIDDKLLIMVAGFREQKDQDTVIKVLEKLPSTYKLLLVGDGARRSILEKIIIEKNLENRVFLLGFRSDVFSLYKMSDIAILSSHWEGFGLAAAEAMACGIPVIASNVDGLAQVVHGGGILFEKENVNDLKDKIISLENKERYISLSLDGLKKAQNYSLKTMVENLISSYKTLL
ncbi:glycosyltransferase [Chryseobacterium sp. RG1]|uniref:Glycosyltransferase n=1 Tax=Chryseobacterium tagetis TaxID=2801334 RepID=A0ABS8A552_9FLAO|nr:glycosyltransferase [Chryseobacterium tagetis]MCA6069111.1 glycosyltransferase [Chryseobacterium tagetis]